MTIIKKKPSELSAETVAALESKLDILTETEAESIYVKVEDIETPTAMSLETLSVSTTATVPTKAVGTNTTDAATTAFVQAAIESLIEGTFVMGAYQYKIKPDSLETTLIPNWSGLLTNPIAIFEFDETSGSIAENKVDGASDGVIVGATINQTGIVGKAYLFGAGQYVVSNSPAYTIADTTKLSISIKFNFSSVINNRYIIQFFTGGTIPIGVRTNATNQLVVHITTDSGDQFLAYTAAPSLNEWHTLIVTVDGNTVSTYLDNVFQDSDTYTGTITVSSNALYFSGSTNNVGLIDQSGIWPFVLTPAQRALIQENKDSSLW